MKKIINGLLYDTQKATLIWTDDSNRHERLYYKTDKGNYFCLYANNVISPMTEEEIKVLLGENAVEVYMELFPLPELA